MIKIRDIGPHTLLIALLICTGMNAQFKLLPDSNASWTPRNYDLGGTFDFTYTYHLEPVNHDTLINGTSYSYLYLHDGSGLWPGAFGGGIRDNGQGQAFYYHHYLSQEYLVYDLDVLVGDTVRDVWVGSISSQVNTIDLYIASVDTITIAGQLLRRVGVQNQASILGGQGVVHWWVEGIGGTNGLLETYGGTVLDVVSGLQCMSAIDTTWWTWGPNGTTGECSPTSLIEPLNEETNLWLTPTVSSSSVTINTKSRQSLTLEFYTTQGQLVKRIRSPSSQVTVADLLPGVYIARLINPTGEFRTSRFVRQ